MLHTLNRIINLAVHTILRDHELGTLDPHELGPLAEAQGRKVGLRQPQAKVLKAVMHIFLACVFLFFFFCG